MNMATSSDKKTIYIHQGTQRPIYNPFPLFLMEYSLSMTARVLYSFLLNRALLSQKNRWVDDNGRVYIFFTEREMSRVLHKGLTTVKTALGDLEQVGLLERVRQPNSNANRIYVKVAEGQSSDKAKQSSASGQRNYSYEGDDSL